MKIEADTSDLTKYEKLMTQIPGKMRGIIADTLNKQAQDMKFKHVPDALNDAFTIRNKNFMHRQIRYNKAKQSGDPATNFSEVGSIETERFSGWEEQQTGKPSETKRTASDAARGGDYKKKMRPSSRMKKGNVFRKASDYKGPRIKTKSQQTWAMLFESRKQRMNFMIRKSDSRPGRLYSLKPGLYGWIGKKLMRLQKFDTRYNPKKTDWMGNSIKRLVAKKGGFEQVFERELRKALSKGGLDA